MPNHLDWIRRRSRYVFIAIDVLESLTLVWCVLAVPLDALSTRNGGMIVLKRQIDTTVCAEKYKKSGNHTMCLTDSPNVRDFGVSETDKKEIVRLHNQYRSLALRAANMQQAVWDNKLAIIAQKWAMQCVSKHDLLRDEPDYGEPVGQNVAFGYSSWDGAISGWYEEVRIYSYGESQNNFIDIGHYTQLVQAGAVKVGCGFSLCSSGYRTFFVCNYIKGNWNISHPYKRGLRSCADCPRFCKNNLCNCGGKFCFNGGSMNLNTCNCVCNKAYRGPQCREKVCPRRCLNGGSMIYSTCSCTCYSLFRGRYCEERFCPFKEPSYCGEFWPFSYCARYPRSVPRDCPYMCDQCQESPSCDEDSLCFISPSRCVFYGRRPSTEECLAFPTGGVDSIRCRSQGGSLGCESCDGSDVPINFCPVQCGLCNKNLCDIRSCMNGGTLNEIACSCSCTRGWEGRTCSQRQCRSLTCRNGGTPYYLLCLCICPPGFTGKSCETQLCPGVRCLNGGTLDTTSCSCLCYAVYHGSRCEKEFCPAADMSFCGKNAWIEENCQRFTNLPKHCPYLCKYCSDERRSSCEDDPLCYISDYGCKYIGLPARSSDCKMLYGDGQGHDRYFCLSRRGIWGCATCLQNVIAKYHCPYTCGFCRVN